jgi:predicted TIM-barrel fold metal-dependent hydrolase
MGIARGRFVVDTHVHAQRHAAKFKSRGVKPDYSQLASEMYLMDTYDNSPRLLYDMERYSVDMCVLQLWYGMDNDLNAQIVKENPGKFIATCNAVQTMKRALRGEIKWTAETAAKEIDELLSTGCYQGGIGEGIPYNPTRDEHITWKERLAEIRQIMNVARKHKVPVGYHTGHVIGYGAAGGSVQNRNISAPDWTDPLLAHDVCQEYPDVPIIMQHGGIACWWSEMYLDRTLQVVASYDNAYLETGTYWPELYDKALLDPNIGADKLLWGTDWGASLVVYAQPGRYPSSYLYQIRHHGPPSHQPDYFGWSLRQVDKLDISQDDLNLILGGNAVQLYKLEVPHTRMFRERSV